ncbi:30S ribosomal protein S16 [Candidatus Uhrbacteria bacterium]|nr:30S ribosomal protein S16 [Candidatus Uhrbacteria bacterium]
MLSIRLSRVGTKRAPVYRVVVMPKHNDPWAIATEILGHYNPRKDPRELVLNVERVKYWLEKGAEVSNTMWNLFIDEKIVEGKKHGVTHISGTRAKKLDEKAAEAKAKAEEAATKAKEAAEAAKVVVEAPAEEQPAPTLSEAEVGAPTDNVGAQ